MMEWRWGREDEENNGSLLRIDKKVKGRFVGKIEVSLGRG